MDENTSVKELDSWISRLEECKKLEEKQIKLLCDKVCDCWMPLALWYHSPPSPWHQLYRCAYDHKFTTHHPWGERANCLFSSASGCGLYIKLTVCIQRRPEHNYIIIYIPKALLGSCSPAIIFLTPHLVAITICQ